MAILVNSDLWVADDSVSPMGIEGVCHKLGLFEARLASDGCSGIRCARTATKHADAKSTFSSFLQLRLRRYSRSAREAYTLNLLHRTTLRQVLSPLAPAQPLAIVVLADIW